MELITLHRVAAYLGLLVFVASTTIGFGMHEAWMGFVALGLTSGVASFLLGLSVDGDSE